MSNKKSLLKNSGIYGIVQILQKGAGLLLMPIYTQYLTKGENGIITTVQSWVAFFVIFYTLCLNSAVVRFYVDYKEDKNKLKDFWGSCFVFVFLNGLVLTIILILTRHYILSPLIGEEIDFFPFIFLGLISITLNPIYTMMQGILQAKEDGKIYGINNLAYFFFNIGLNLLFIVGFKMGALGILLALAITDVVFFIYAVIKLKSEITFKVKKIYLKEAMKYSLPLLPHSLSGVTVSVIGNIMLSKFNGVEATGVYGNASKFGIVINSLTMAVNQAYVPWFFSKMKHKEENEAEIVNMAEYITIIYGLLAMGLSLFSQEIMYLFAEKSYWIGWKVIPFISFAYVFNGIYFFFVNPLFYNKKGVKFIAIGTFTGAFLSVVLNIALIPIFGDIGAGLSLMISSIISCILIYFICMKVEKIKFNIIKMFGITFLLFAISLFAFVLQEMSFWTSMFIKMGIGIITMMVLGLIYRKQISMLIKKRR